LIVAQLAKKFFTFLETEGSSPCYQDTTGTYSTVSHLISLRCILIISDIYVSFTQGVSSLENFRPKSGPHRHNPQQVVLKYSVRLHLLERERERENYTPIWYKSVGRDSSVGIALG
jgi:hypothetical protein